MGIWVELGVMESEGGFVIRSVYRLEPSYFFTANPVVFMGKPQ